MPPRRLATGATTAADHLFISIKSRAGGNLSTRAELAICFSTGTEDTMKARLALLAAATALGIAASAGTAAAAIPNGLAGIQAPAASPDQVRWVCNPWGRCWWRPNVYRSYGYYGGPRAYGPRWGYGHRGWGGGWHGRRW